MRTPKDIILEDGNSLEYHLKLHEDYLTSKGSIGKVANFNGVDLSEADLREAKLTGAQFCEAILLKTNFSGANLNGTNFCRAKLSGAKFIKTYLNKADLCGANLPRANLNGANLIEANLNEADLCGATFKEAKITMANLSKANFRGANLSEADLSESDLREAIITSANLSKANFTNTNMSGADLYGTNLSGADLTGANLTGAEVNGTKFIGANLTKTNLSGANFDEANLSGANLTDANLSRANLSQVNLLGTNLLGADLDGVKLIGAKLTGANFSETNLNETDFENAYLDGTIFSYLSFTKTKNLDKCLFYGSSVVDINSIPDLDKLPYSFMKGVGFNDQFIENYKSIFSGNPIEFYSCFISFSSKDQDFAERLHADLNAKGIRTWFAPHDLVIGDKTRDRIDEKIRTFDKLLLILSSNSSNSEWVKYETDKAYAKELKSNSLVLFPIRLDDSVFKVKKDWVQTIIETRNIGDFHKWKEHDSYQKSLERLIRDLKAEKRV